jgi:hypothetical protein
MGIVIIPMIAVTAIKPSKYLENGTLILTEDYMTSFRVFLESGY